MVERLYESVALNPLMAYQAGLLAALFEIGSQSIGETAIGPGNEFQPIVGLKVKSEASRSDFFTPGRLRHRVRGDQQRN